MSSPSAITTALLNSAYTPQQQDLFSQIDANGDGQISPDEMSSFGKNLPGGGHFQKQGLFRKIDANGDGSISKDEWAAHRAQRDKTRAALLQVQEQSGGGHHHGPSGARRSSAASQTFNALDTNKDGVVSAEEWTAAYGSANSATVVSDVQSTGVQSAGIGGSVNAAMNNAANTVKDGVEALAQTAASALSVLAVI